MGCGIAIVKYLVFIFNLVFAIIGLALLVIGVFFQIDVKNFDKSFDSASGLAPTLLIVVGALIFIVSFAGCCGAIKESNCMLITYAVLLVIILAVQVGIGVFSFTTLKDAFDIKEDVRSEVQDMFDKYNATQLDRETFDDFQQLMKCCGVKGPVDWNNSIPTSCCIDKSPNCNLHDPGLFNVGCVEKGYAKIHLVVRSVGYLVLGICIAEVIGIFFAFCLTNSIRNQYRRGTYA